MPLPGSGENRSTEERPRTRGDSPHRLVVAIDSSPASGRAGRLAISLASALSGAVWFVHASETDRRLVEPLTDEELAAPSQALTRELESFVSEARSRGLTARAESQEGPPAEVILRVANEVAATLIVVGTRGRGSPSRVLLGSVSARVVANASVPVVVVP